MRYLTTGILTICALGVMAGSSQARPHHRARHHPAAPSAKPVVWTDYAHHPNGYLTAADRPDAKTFLPPPPAPDSPRGQADRAIYLAMKAMVGTPRWREAQADARIELPDATDAFTCAAGVQITPKTTPVASLLLARVMSDVSSADDHAKDDYARKRPFLADDGDTCVEKADWLVKQGSYPSGHAGAGWAWALVLSELEPDRTEALMRRGMRYGESRVVCRVHFASDVEAGRLVAAAVVARLHADPAFQSDMERARIELAHARATTPAPGCTAEKLAAGDR